jgi:hypothetical protein
MANDRVWIVCKGCGKSRLLLKYYPSGDFVDDKEWCNPRVIDFLNAHFDSCRDRGSTLDGEFGFEFLCESKEGFKYGDDGKPIVDS